MGLIDYVRMSTEDRGFALMLDDMTLNGMSYEHAYHVSYRIAYRSHFRTARRPLGVVLALSCVLGGMS